MWWADGMYLPFLILTKSNQIFEFFTVVKCLNCRGNGYKIGFSILSQEKNPSTKNSILTYLLFQRHMIRKVAFVMWNSFWIMMSIVTMTFGYCLLCMSTTRLKNNNFCWFTGKKKNCRIESMEEYLDIFWIQVFLLILSINTHILEYC